MKKSVNGMFSVIIPTYNRDLYLKRAIESVLNQTYRSIEIIVIDDGSIDDTSNILQSYDNKITVIQQAHEGASVARNMGLHQSKGEYITFLDDDDFWHPEFLEKGLKSFKDHPNASISYSWYMIIDLDGNLNRAVRPMYEGDIFSKIFYNNILVMPHLIIRRSSLFSGEELLLQFDTHLKVAEDYKFRLELAASNQFCYIPEYLVYITRHKGSSHSTNSIDEMTQNLLAVEQDLWKNNLTRQKLEKLGARARASWSCEMAYMYLLVNNRKKEALFYLWKAFKAFPLYWKIGLGLAGLIIGRKNIDTFLSFAHRRLYSGQRKI